MKPVFIRNTHAFNGLLTISHDSCCLRFLPHLYVKGVKFKAMCLTKVM